jgi:hypothetical protein
MQKGFLPLLAGPTLFIVLIVLFALIVIGPAIIITFVKELMILFQLAASIVIISWVRNTVGPGLLSYAISAILIYIFVFILPQISIMLWAIMTIMGIGLWSTMFWGLTFFRKVA